MNGETTDDKQWQRPSVMNPAWQNPVKQPVTYYSMGTKDIVFFILGLIVCIAAVPFTLWGGFKSGFTVSYAAVFVLFTAYLVQKGARPGFYGTIAGVLSLLGSSVFAYSSNGAVNFFLFLLVFINATIWFSSLCGLKDSKTDMSFLFAAVGRPFAWAFGKMPKMLRSVFSSNGEKTKAAGKAMIGLVCALPVLIAVTFLLASADAAFESVLGKLTGTELVMKIITGLIFAPFILSFFFALKKEEKKEYNGKVFSGMKENTYIISFLGVICAVYLLYLFSQFAYVTSALSGILPEKVLPAEYARRGFFEMCIIAGINLALVYLAQYLMGKQAKGRGTVKAECTFICLFTLFIIATAIAKMIIYINRFGMTELRIYTSVFMIFIAVAFIALVVRLYVKKVPVFRIAATWATVLLIALGATNINDFVAEYNVNAFLEGRLSHVDVEKLEDLDLAAVPALIKLESERVKTNGEKNNYADLAGEALIRLNSRYFGEEAYSEAPEPGSWNYSDYRGKTELEKRFK